jgi:hypothetical protein
MVAVGRTQNRAASQLRRSHNCPKSAVLRPLFGQTGIASFVNDRREWPVDSRGTMVQSPPLADNDWPKAEQISSARSARDSDVRADFRFGSRPTEETKAPFRFRTRERRSIGGRMFRAVTRFAMAVLIGVGATLGWQSYGDAATEMLAAQVPTLAYLLSVLPTKPPIAAAAATGRTQQLEPPLASYLDAVRQNLDQLAVRQDQMTQRIVALQAVEEDIRQRISIAPPPAAPAPQPAAIPQPKPAQPKVQPQAAQTSSQSSSVPRTPPGGPVVLTR